MPIFELNDGSGEGVRVDSVRLTFKRGVRLMPASLRRTRDILMTMLASLGMDPEDIGRLFRMTSRNCRGRLEETPVSMQSAIARVCHEVMKREREKARLRPARPEGLAIHAGRGNGVARRGRSKHQATFSFDVEQLDGR